LEYEVIWGHVEIWVVAVRRLSRRWKVKTILAGPSPTSPMKAEITISPISNSAMTDTLYCTTDTSKVEEGGKSKAQPGVIRETLETVMRTHADR